VTEAEKSIFDQPVEVIRSYAESAELMVVAEADDDALAENVASGAGGARQLVYFLADGMALAFAPDRANGESALIEFVVTAPDEQIPFWLSMLPDACLREIDGSDPDTVLRMSLATFLRIAFKRLTGVDAYLDGKIEASGDVVLATTMDEWFDLPDLTLRASR
jgi:hypothetical protein